MTDFFEQVFDKGGGALPYIARTVAFSILIVFAIVLPAIALGIAHPSEDFTVPLPEIIIGALLVAPLLENLFLIGFIELLSAAHVPKVPIIIAVAAISGYLHAVVGDWRAVSGAVLFAVMAYSYLLWRNETFARRFSITLAQHALFNIPATASEILDALI